MGRLGAIGVAWALAALVAAPTAGAAGWVEPERTGPSRWYLARIDSPRSIAISVGSGYCVGKARPSLRPARVRWLPGAVVITARVHSPRVRFGAREACAGVGLGMEQRLHLAHSLAGRAIYDGNASPPQWRGGMPIPFTLRAAALRVERLWALWSMLRAVTAG